MQKYGGAGSRVTSETNVRQTRRGRLCGCCPKLWFFQAAWILISTTGICCSYVLLLNLIAIQYKCLKYLVFSLLSFVCVCVCVCVCIDVCLHIYSQTRGKGMSHVKYHNPPANLPTWRVLVQGTVITSYLRTLNLKVSGLWETYSNAELRSVWFHLCVWRASHQWKFMASPIVSRVMASPIVARVMASPIVALSNWCANAPANRS